MSSDHYSQIYKSAKIFHCLNKDSAAIISALPLPLKAHLHRRFHQAISPSDAIWTGPNRSQGRFPELENFLLKSPRLAFNLGETKKNVNNKEPWLVANSIQVIIFLRLEKFPLKSVFLLSSLS